MKKKITFCCTVVQLKVLLIKQDVRSKEIFFQVKTRRKNDHFYLYNFRSSEK